MRTRTRPVLVVTALLVAVPALQTETADAAQANRSARRDAVMERCIAKAQAETPFYNPMQPGYRRVDLYKSCMIQAGMRP